MFRTMQTGAEDFVVGDLAIVQAGFPFRGAVEATANGSVHAVQLKDTTESGVDWTGVARTNASIRRPESRLRDGDLLFVARGPRFYALCVSDPPLDSVCSPHFFHLRLHSEARVLPEYLAWIINRPPVQRQIYQAAEGSNQLSIRRPELEQLRVRIPSFSDQHRIVTLMHLAHREQTLLRQLVANREREQAALAETLFDSHSSR